MTYSTVPQNCHKFVALDEYLGVCGYAKLVRTHIWELRDVHILLSEDTELALSERELAILAGRFYHQLFEVIYSTSEQQGIKQILMATSMETIQDAWNVGWPLREVEDDCLYLDTSPTGHAELLRNRKLFEQSVSSKSLH